MLIYCGDVSSRLLCNTLIRMFDWIHVAFHRRKCPPPPGSGVEVVLPVVLIVPAPLSLWGAGCLQYYYYCEVRPLHSCRVISDYWSPWCFSTSGKPSNAGWSCTYPHYGFLIQRFRRVSLFTFTTPSWKALQTHPCCSAYRSKYYATYSSSKAYFQM